jgi:hypothetical protein
VDTVWFVVENRVKSWLAAQLRLVGLFIYLFAAVAVLTTHQAAGVCELLVCFYYHYRWTSWLCLPPLQGIRLKLVLIPCWPLFEVQPSVYLLLVFCD